MIYLPTRYQFTFSSTNISMYCDKGYNHTHSSKYKHHHKVCRSASETAFLQHSTISICEYHVEQEIKTNWSKEQKRCDKSPYLVVFDD